MPSTCWRKQQEFKTIFSASKWIGAFIVLGALASTALAGEWKTTNVSPQHPTWFFTPDNKLKNSDKRGLMLVLHGCVQTHDQIKEGGNLEKAAEEYGLVLALPYVTPQDGWHPFPGSDIYCWGYDKQLADEQGHVKEITELAQALQSPSLDLRIDPDHVYVIGLSSGGALALKAGCKAPDVFAGVGAIAGPSVGSNQMIATTDGSGIPQTNVQDAVNVCKSMAGSKASFLQTQIANIAHGDMDRNGPKQIQPCQADAHPGRNCVASVRWSEDNIKILQNIYGAGSLGSAKDVQGGEATEQSAKVGDAIVLSYLILHNGGHAFFAGSGKPNNDTYGQYIAQEGANYSLYVAGWFEENNRRRSPAGPVVACSEVRVSGNSLGLSCNASSPNTISAYHVVLSGPSPKDDTLPGGPGFSKQYDNLASGHYTVLVNATDDHGKKSTDVSKEFDVPGMKCFTESNSTHVSGGRAYGCRFFGMQDCAKGSNDSLGWWFYETSLRETTNNYWTKVNSCQ